MKKKPHTDKNTILNVFFFPHLDSVSTISNSRNLLEIPNQRPINGNRKKAFLVPLCRICQSPATKDQ